MAASVARTRSRPLFATAIAALLLFVLSGCMKYSADFHVDAEETLSGSMQILVDPIALEDMGSPNPSQDLDDAVREAQADPDVPDGVSVDRVEDEDGYIGMAVTFDRVPASEFQNGGGGLDGVGIEGIEVAHSDGEISFTMTNPLMAGTDSSDQFGSTSGMPTTRSMFDEAVVSVTFPGNVIAADGAETTGKTATWNLREYDGDTLTASGDASNFPWAIILIAGGALFLLLIAVGAIVLILVLRKRNSSSSSGIATTTLPVAGVTAYPGSAYPIGPQPQGGSWPVHGPQHDGGYSRHRRPPTAPPHPGANPQSAPPPPPGAQRSERFAPPPDDGSRHPGNWGV